MRVVAVFKVLVKMSNQLIREDAALLWHWKGICGSQAWNLDGDPMSRPLGWIGAMFEMDWSLCLGSIREKAARQLNAKYLHA